MKYPVNRRGKSETIDHFLQRLNNRRIEAYLQSVQNKWGEFLNTYPWDVVAHFSFASKFTFTVDSATHAFQNYLLKYPGCYSYFSIEDKPAPHVHALIGRVGRLDIPWGLGKYQIDIFDPSKGAAWYVSKSPSNWQMFGGFPKERPVNADRWWRPGITLDPRNIVGLNYLPIRVHSS